MDAALTADRLSDAGQSGMAMMGNAAVPGVPWRSVVSRRSGTELSVAEGALRIAAVAHSVAFIERPLPPGVSAVACRLHSGSDHGESWGGGLMLAWPGEQLLRINIRATERRFGIDDGRQQWFAGTAAPDAVHDLRILLGEHEVLMQARTDEWLWMTLKRFSRSAYPGAPVMVRVGKMDTAGRGEDYVAPGTPGTCRVQSVTLFGR
jgi:hypothetical protein